MTWSRTLGTLLALVASVAVGVLVEAILALAGIPAAGVRAVAAGSAMLTLLGLSSSGRKRSVRQILIVSAAFALAFYVFERLARSWFG